MPASHHGALGARAALAAAGEGLAGESFPFSFIGEKLAASKSTRNGRVDGCDLAERAVHVSFELEEIAWLSLSFLRFRAGALWKEAEGAAAGSPALKGMFFFGERDTMRRRYKRAGRA